MTEGNIAYKHLLDAVLNRHSEHRTKDSEDIEDDFFEFSDDELKRMVDALWADRYSTDQKTFQNVVGEMVSRKVSGE